MLRKHEEDSDLGKGRAIAKAQKTLMKQTEIQWLGQDGRLFLSQVTDQGWAGVPGMWAALLCSALLCKIPSCLAVLPSTEQCLIPRVQNWHTPPHPRPSPWERGR